MSCNLQVSGILLNALITFEQLVNLIRRLILLTPTMELIQTHI